jgi:hypothetical protein
MHCQKLMFISSSLLILSAAGNFVRSQESSRPSAKRAEVQSVITYCNLDLADKWKTRNLSFNSLYSFTVGKNGEVIKIRKVRDNFIGEEPVKSCVSEWRITGFPENSQFSVYFIWKHGRGWVRQEISGNGFSQIMTMENVGVRQL